MASRGAAYFAASCSTMSATLRTPSHSCSTSTAISSGARIRSGARITQTFRVSSNFSSPCRGSTGRLASLTVMWRGAAMNSTFCSTFWNERTGRNVALDIGVIERVELHPQHVGLEDQGIADQLPLFRRSGVFPDIVERKPCIARRLLQAAAEIAHDIRIDEIIMLQHARDPLFMQVRRKQLGERGRDRLQRALVAAEMHIGFHRKARGGEDALGGFHIGAVEAKALGQLQPALDAALAADVAVIVLDAMPPFHTDIAFAEARDHHRIL